MDEADANHGLPPSAFMLDTHVQDVLDMSFARDFHFNQNNKGEEPAMNPAMLSNIGQDGLAQDLAGGFDTSTMPFLSGQSTPFTYPATPLAFGGIAGQASQAPIPQRSNSDGMAFATNLGQALAQPYEAAQHAVQTGDALGGGPLGTNNMTYDVVEPQEQLKDLTMDAPAVGQQSPPRRGRPSHCSSTAGESPRASKRKTSISSAAGKKTDGKVSTFLTKLYAILESPEYQHMIHWDQDGSQIVIELPSELESKVLPLVYKQSRFASFSRQLNIYGWMRKVSLRNTGRDGTEQDASQWSHAFLNRRSNPLDLISYKRRVPPRISTRRVSQSSEAGKGERRDSSGDDIEGPWTGFELVKKEEQDTAQPLPVAYMPMTAALPIPRRTSAGQAGRRASNGWEGGPAPSPHRSQLTGFQTKPYPKHNDFSSREVAWSQAFRLRNPFEGLPVSAPAAHPVFQHHGASYGTSSDSMSSDGCFGLSSVPPAVDPPGSFRHPADRQDNRNLPAITRLTQEVDSRDRGEAAHINITKRQLGSMSTVEAQSSYFNSLPQFGHSQSTFFSSTETAGFPFTPPPDQSQFAHRPLQVAGQRDAADSGFEFRPSSVSTNDSHTFSFKSPVRNAPVPAFKSSLATIQNSDFDALPNYTPIQVKTEPISTDAFRHTEFMLDPDDVLNSSWRASDRLPGQ